MSDYGIFDTGIFDTGIFDHATGTPPPVTYGTGPSIGEIVLYAFNLCQIRPTSLVQEHMQSSRQAMNMMLARWANMGVNLWKVDTQTITAQEGVSTYSVPADTIMILDMYARTPSGTTNTDRIMMPISRS